jgi:hypothetical protein
MPTKNNDKQIFSNFSHGLNFQKGLQIKRKIFNKNNYSLAFERMPRYYCHLFFISQQTLYI